MEKDYKDTLNLPETAFPMKANLAQREPEMLAFWRDSQIAEKLVDSNKDKPSYILHDGPPYANGHIHIGHALNKILKDIIVKYKSMQGFSSPYVPGWDCHGLPIEHQVLKNLGPKKDTMSKAEIRKLCREYAVKFIDIQREEFKRLGVFGDWDNPYLTMNYAYEAAIVRELGKFVGTGGVYKGQEAGVLVRVLRNSPCRGGGRVRGPRVALHLGQIRALPDAAKVFPSLAGKNVAVVDLDHDPLDARLEPCRGAAS